MGDVDFRLRARVTQRRLRPVVQQAATEDVLPLGGGTLSGCSKPGEIVWSRVYIEAGRLHVDIGRGHVADLPAEETQRRLDATTPEWPIMHAVLHGVDRDQLMAKHKANHVQVAYCPDADTANRAATVKAALFDTLGIDVHLCGNINLIGAE